MTGTQDSRARTAFEAAARFARAALLEGRYGLACRGSDETIRFSDNKGHVFTGFFLARAFGGRLNEIERTILLVRILSEENGGSWGFSPAHPYVGPEHRHFIVDSDDTAYVLRTCRLLGANRACDGLLRYHRESCRAFVTFDAGQAAALSSSPAFENNLACHPEVNANVFLCLAETHHAGYVNDDLIDAWQDRSGYWPAYFYPSPYFATALFTELLVARGRGASAAAEQARRFLADEQAPDGSWSAAGDLHETALALEAACHLSLAPDRLAAAAEFLLSRQDPDGAWRSPSAIWRYPDRGGDVWTAFDEHGTYVTARCAYALRLATARR